MLRDFTFNTTCVNSTGEAIDAMTATGCEVTLATIRRHCEGLREWQECMGYETRRRDGLRLKDDWAVSYWKGTYEGKPCYYIVHSMIEHIWTKG